MASGKRKKVHEIRLESLFIRDLSIEWIGGSHIGVIEEWMGNEWQSRDHFFKKFAMKGTIRFAMGMRKGFLRQKRSEEIDIDEGTW